MGPKPIPSSTLALFLPQASEYEKQVLSDGMLTLAEYEAAKLAQVQCLQEAGLTVINAHLNGVYLYRFVIKFESRSGAVPSTIGSCRKQYVEVIDPIWAEVSVPLAQSTIDESRRLMAECYKQSGLKVEDHPQDSLDPDVLDKYNRCKEQVQTALDIEGLSYGVEGDGRPH